jgi:AraC family transcriptional regulator
VAQAFLEPPQIASWVVPARPAVSLIVFAGGPMHLERREADGPWAACDLVPEDLILRPATNRSYEMRWTSLSPAPTRTLNLRVSTDLLARTAAEVADYDPARLSLVERLGFQDPLLAQIGFALWRELEQPAPAGRLYAETAAQLLAVHLLRHYTSATRRIWTPTAGLTRRQLRRLTDYIRAHLSEELSLAVLAQQAGFSPYHFARVFRQAAGESPHHYVLRQRLETAQRLLKEPVPLAYVARASGFANQSHFTRTFKRHLGLTPGAYRRSCEIGARLDQKEHE